MPLSHLTNTHLCLLFRGCAELLPLSCWGAAEALEPEVSLSSLWVWGEVEVVGCLQPCWLLACCKTPGCCCPSPTFTSVSVGYWDLNKSHWEAVLWCFCYIFLCEVSCPMSLQDVEQRKAVEIIMGTVRQCYYYVYWAATDALLKADHKSNLKTGTVLTNTYF